MKVALSDWKEEPPFQWCKMTIGNNLIRIEGFPKENETVILQHKVPKDFPWNMLVQTKISVSAGITSFGLGFGGLVDLFGYGLRKINWGKNEIGLSANGSDNLYPINRMPQLQKINQPLVVGGRYPFITSPEGAIKFTQSYYSGLERYLYIQIIGNPKSCCEFTMPELLSDNGSNAINVIHWSEFGKLVPKVPLGEVNLGGKTFDELLLAILNLEPTTLRIYYDQELGYSRIHQEYLRLLEFQQRRLGFNLEKLKVEASYHITERIEKPTISSVDLTQYGDNGSQDKE